MENKAALWLIEKRKLSKMSLRELGKAAGVAHASIAKAENGEASFDTWIKLAEYFDENPQVILAWANKIEPVNNDDPWVVEMSHKLSQLSPDLRGIAESVIGALRKNEKGTRKRTD